MISPAPCDPPEPVYLSFADAIEEARTKGFGLRCDAYPQVWYKFIAGVLMECRERRDPYGQRYVDTNPAILTIGIITGNWSRLITQVEESAGDLPKIGTFEWVLARVRHGAEYSQFRRRGWAKRWPDAVLDISVPGPAAIIDTRYPAYEDAYIRMLDASDMTADDWEEVD